MLIWSRFHFNGVTLFYYITNVVKCLVSGLMDNFGRVCVIHVVDVWRFCWVIDVNSIFIGFVFGNVDHTANWQFTDKYMVTSVGNVTKIQNGIYTFRFGQFLWNQLFTCGTYDFVFAGNIDGVDHYFVNSSIATKRANREILFIFELSYELFGSFQFFFSKID